MTLRRLLQQPAPPTHMKHAPLDRATLELLLRLIVIGIAIGLIADLADDGLIQPSGFFSNLSTELIGSAVTFFLLERTIRTREKAEDAQQQETMEKTRLLAHLGSRANVSALEAAEELKSLGWLTDGSLRRAHLSGANLAGADLEGAVLEWADLRAANLRRARLHKANLAVAHLEKAHLHGAILTDANLQATVLVEADLKEVEMTNVHLEEADLYRANLRDAELSYAKLHYADLSKANLEGAVLYKAEFDVHTTLPDGHKWSPGTDLARFTDPQHPAFWRSDDLRSPAHAAPGRSVDDTVEER